jgi:Rrf2 family transcriptional repressor of oqxAB
MATASIATTRTQQPTVTVLVVAMLAVAMRHLLQTALVSVTITVEALHMDIISNNSGWFPVAVQALVVIARTDGLCPSHTMAHDLNAHAVFVRRVLAQLARVGIVQAREGRVGGYRLARPAQHITLADIYRAVKQAEPQPESACSGTIHERVQIVLDEVGTEAEQLLLTSLSQHTLASVIERIGSLSTSIN